MVLRLLNMTTSWGEKRILNRQNKRTCSLQEVSAERKKLYPWIVVLTRNEERVYTDHKIESLVSDN
jgi:hypothetical protein